MNSRLANKNKVYNPEAYEAMKDSEIVRRIRKKYSLEQELAILRQRDTKPNEFSAYNAYVEDCKREVKLLLGELL